MDSTFLAIILAIVAAIPGVWGLISRQRQVNADTERLLAEAEGAEGDAADKITSSALLLVEPLTTRIKTQDIELSVLRSELHQKEAENEELNKQVIKLREVKLETDAGIERLMWQFKSIQVEPVWRPRKENGD